MALTRWGFESGANGDNLNGVNANADFPVVTGGTAVISTAHTIEGTRSALLTATTTSGAVYFQKTVPTTSQLAVDTFIYITTLPTVEVGVVWLGAGATRQVHVSAMNDGRIRLRDASGGGGATLWTSTQTMSLNTWYRIAIYTTPNATTGTVRAALYAGGSSSPIADSTLLTNVNTGATQFETVRIGTKVSTGTTEFIAYFDNYGYDSAATDLPAVGGSGPSANANVSATVRIVDASASTGTGLTYGITQTSGPTKTATLLSAGKWSIPVDATLDTHWDVTVTQSSDSQTSTTSVTIPKAPSQGAPVELLYATGPGTFV